jgi:hypothetical protein
VRLVQVAAHREAALSDRDLAADPGGEDPVRQQREPEESGHLPGGCDWLDRATEQSDEGRYYETRVPCRYQGRPAPEIDRVWRHPELFLGLAQRGPPERPVLRGGAAAGEADLARVLAQLRAAQQQQQGQDAPAGVDQGQDCGRPQRTAFDDLDRVILQGLQALKQPVQLRDLGAAVAPCRPNGQRPIRWVTIKTASTTTTTARNQSTR